MPSPPLTSGPEADPGARTLGRRHLLVATGVGGLVAACSGGTATTTPGGSGTTIAPTSTAAPAAAATTTTAPTSTTASPVAADPALHLVRRITYGPTPGLVDDVRATGVETFLDTQLAADGPDDPDLDALLAGLPHLDLEPAELRDLDLLVRVLAGELQAATLLRRWMSRHQLFETMVEFWSDHLNVDIHAGVTTFLKFPEDRNVIRPHALGRFDELLAASARSPAMLAYLDNATSRADGANVPNENYARELLELHTVGVDGGYDEDDVVATARVLSGWSIDRTTGHFLFIEPWHGATGTETVMDWWAGGRTGLEAGTSLLRHLAHHPATARHLATKLCRRYVADEPPASLVATASQVYLDHRTEIRPVLRHILTSDEFAASADRKVRRPADFVLAALRATGARIDGPLEPIARILVTVTEAMGHAPMAWGPPTGYPDGAGAWMNSSALLARWNAAQALFLGSAPGERGRLGIDVRALLGEGEPATVGEAVDRLAGALVGAPLDPDLRAPIAAHLAGAEPGSDEPWDQARHAAGLDQAAALVVHSPAFHLR